MNFYIKTLGCKVNQYEEQVFRENLVSFGFKEAEASRADLIIVNSCTVTNQADNKTKKLIRKLKGENNAAKIFVTGCGTVFDEDARELESLPEVYRVVSGKDKMKLLNEVLDLGSEKKIKTGITGFGSHTRVFLKIQDGCNHKCSYCKVSLVRGPSICRNEKDIIDELKVLISGGYKEIVLTGICLGAWNNDENRDLSYLIKKIVSLNDNFRIRLSSIEPYYINESLIDLMVSNDKICRHLHIPLQSGSNHVLKLMCRRYNTDNFKKMIDQIREKLPYAGITIDVIAGFPGETETDFKTTLNFIREIAPARMHVFRYSDRKGTPSFHFKDKISPRAAKERVSELMDVGKKLERDFCQRFVNKEVEVLVEKPVKSGYKREGYTGEYIKVRSNALNWNEGDIIKVKVTDIDARENFLIVGAPSIQIK